MTTDTALTDEIPRMALTRAPRHRSAELAVTLEGFSRVAYVRASEIMTGVTPRTQKARELMRQRLASGGTVTLSAEEPLYAHLRARVQN